MAAMIWIGLTLFLATNEIALPGPAPPAFMVGTPGRYLVLRQPEGAFPQWWSVREAGAEKVTLPLNARCAAPLADGSGMLVIQGDRAQRYAWQDGTWGPQGEPLMFETPLGLTQPRLDGALIKIGARWLLPVFTDDGLLVLQADPELKLVGRVKLPASSRGSTWSTGEVTYAEPRPMADREGFSWMWGTRFMRWLAQAPNEVRIEEPPRVRNMERAVGLVAGGETFWLVHGGQRGDLDSFGWRLVNGKGQTLAQDSGILTRIEWQADPQQPGLAIWTVSQKISSQLYAAIAGHRTFSGRRLQWGKDGWCEVAALDLKMGKGKGDGAFALIWTAHADSDGDLDLIAVDEKSGLRVFRGLPAGRLSDDAVKLGNAPNGVLVCEDRLFLASRDDAGWQLKPLEMNP